MNKFNLSRRQWLSKVSQTTAATAAISAFPAIAKSSAGHVVIVGGGTLCKTL